MRLDCEELAQVLYYVHEHCRLPGFYDAEGVSEDEEGTRTQTDWSMLPDIAEDETFVDRNYFRRLAVRFVEILEKHLSQVQLTEELARLFSSVHCYKPLDYSFWLSLPDQIDDPSAVDRSFFRNLAASVMPRLQKL